MAVHRAPQETGRQRRRLMVYAPPILTAIVGSIVVALVLMDRDDAEPALDDDLCPLDDGQISERVALLLDLRKPLFSQGDALLGEAVRTITASMKARAELRIFRLADDSGKARQAIGRLCKPGEVADAGAASTSFDQSATATDPCADLPADASETTATFCAHRFAFKQRIAQLAAAAPDAPVASAYLVEALEETSLAYADARQTQPRSIYVFSDMAQHAAWYSHWELGWESWDFNDFQRRRDEQVVVTGPRPPSLYDVATTVFYVPRLGATDQPSERMAHKRFWRDYMASAFGTAPTFVDQPAMPMYDVAPLMSKPPATADVEQERLLAEQERLEAERLLAQIEQELAELEEVKRNVDEEQQRLARATELRRQRAEAQRDAEAAPILPPPSRPALAETSAPSSPRPAVAQQVLPPASVPASAPASATGSAAGIPISADLSTIPQPPTAERIAAEPARTARNDDLDAASSPPTQGSEAPSPAVPPSPPAANPDLPQPSANLAAVGSAELPPCPASLRARYRDVLPETPRGRAQYARASIVVRYALNDEGETIDAEVVAVPELSTSDPPDFIDQFSESAQDLVRLWRYEFDDAAPCVKRQQRSTQIEFRYR